MSKYDENEKEERARNSLENYVKEWKIFIDTCSILNSNDKFWNNIVPLLQKYNNKLIIPLRCIEELERHLSNEEDPTLSKKTKVGIKRVAKLSGLGLIEVRGEESDNFADNVFLTVFTKLRMKYNLLLITHDGKLARDIYRINESESVIAKTVHVKKTNRYGYLSNFSRTKESNEKNTDFNNAVYEDNSSFRTCTEITTIEDANLNVSYIPKDNESIYTTHGEIRLNNELAAGGEGIIYETNTPYVAKIYKRENNTRRKYEKIKLMISKKIKCEGICYPVEILYNAQNEFVGYLMPRAKGKELQKSIFIKPLFIKNFPDWKKRDTVELCITILEKIKYLHSKNIIMGDINPSNILVVSPKEVYLVDTDSYQIENFPCPVGTINFTAPEIQRRHFSTFLRTIENENFAVATLLFMIMLPGKPPYSQQGGENPVDNIINMDFSYPFGESSNKKTPEGPWRYIWSHLTYDLKQAFYSTFKKGEAHSANGSRLSVDEWLNIFKYYLELLDSGKFAIQDKMSEELFPTRHKKNPKNVYVICRLCGDEVDERLCQNGICKNCLNKGETYSCSRCGKEIFFSNYQKYIKNAKPYSLCPDCFKYNNQTRLIQTCANCGKRFEITNGQYEFFINNGSLPKRCEACRQIKKAYSGSDTSDYNQTQRERYTAKNTTQSTLSSSLTGKKKSSCFITTAVCEYYGKPDDCDELMILRKYRDTWLKKQPRGQELIDDYYNKAPVIVQKLKDSKYYEKYCTILWNEYIRPCVAMIIANQFEECKNKYIEMVKYIQKELIKGR